MTSRVESFENTDKLTARVMSDNSHRRTRASSSFATPNKLKRSSMTRADVKTSALFDMTAEDFKRPGSRAESREGSVAATNKFNKGRRQSTNPTEHHTHASTRHDDDGDEEEQCLEKVKVSIDGHQLQDELLMSQVQNINEHLGRVITVMEKLDERLKGVEGRVKVIERILKDHSLEVVAKKN